MIDCCALRGALPFPSFVFERLNAVVRVNRDIIDLVVFVGVRAGEDFVPLGTAFLGAVDIEGYTLQFLVTADHVLKSIQGDEFAVRVNRRGGGVSNFAATKRFALRHTDENNDIAVIPVHIPPDAHAYKLLPIHRENIESARKNVWDVGVGDDVCAVGLYTSHHGQTKNIPVVRLGNLAAMCDEPVRVLGGGYVDAYLVELRTIAGLSGSPVFVIPPPVAIRDGTFSYRTEVTAKPIPLGILVGYHVVESKEDQIQVPRFSGPQNAASAERDYSADERNTGFGVVIPIERVLEILEREDVKDAMNKVVDAARKKPGFKSASVKDPRHPTAENPDHKEDFKRLLSAAVKPPKSGGQT